MKLEDIMEAAGKFVQKFDKDNYPIRNKPPRDEFLNMIGKVLYPTQLIYTPYDGKKISFIEESAKEYNLKAGKKFNGSIVFNGPPRDHESLIASLQALTNPRFGGVVQLVSTYMNESITPKNIKELENLTEGNQSQISNPMFVKAYGVKTFGDIYLGLQKDLPAIMKQVKGWFIDMDDKTRPLKLINKKADEIITITRLGGRFMASASKAVFDIKDIKP